jgi:hypothetical protein
MLASTFGRCETSSSTSRVIGLHRLAAAGRAQDAHDVGAGRVPGPISNSIAVSISHDRSDEDLRSPLWAGPRISTLKPSRLSSTRGR